MITIGVELGARRYDVRVGSFAADAAADALASALPGITGAAVLVDGDLGRRSPRVAPLLAALARRVPRVARRDLPAGEGSKNLTEIERTMEWLAAEGFDRRAAVIGVGGGATTDHAGFAAAIYLRGVAFAACPTTLLGMVDASVGGKTGVDLEAGKNLVGAFHQPRAVIADLGFLETLPARERVAGLAEVIKCGFIADPSLLAAIEAWPSDAGAAAYDPDRYLPLIAGAVRVKAEVVAEDEHEGGRRAILNFGHTLGHAVEAASGYDLLHGEAVSLGMVAALSFGTARGITPAALGERARRLLASVGLPVDVERRLDRAVLARVSVDKKRRGGQIRFVFCPAAGQTRLEDVTFEEITSHFLSVPPGARTAGPGT
ncbi:MAG TPA: 3-dehydroquinate synthase [Polyangia bacterium]|nr:3-dehydroquinate synthase [Polyangia bacterium]